MTIVNYAIREKLEVRFETFPKLSFHRRIRWLARPINWILRLLQAQAEIPFSTMSRVRIDVDDIKNRIHTVRHELMRRGEKEPTMLILGQHEYRKLITDCPMLWHTQSLDMDQFCGLKVILNPYIDGIVLI